MIVWVVVLQCTGLPAHVYGVHWTEEAAEEEMDRILAVKREFNTDSEIWVERCEVVR